MTRIRVGVDGSAASERAVCWAAEAARVLGASLEVVTVYGTPGLLAVERRAMPLEADAEEVVRNLLGEVVDREAGDVADLDVQTRVLLGHEVEQLCNAEPLPDLVVVGTRGVGGFAGLVLGSTAHKVIEHARGATVVVPNREPLGDPAGLVVVGVDGSSAAEAALEWAARHVRRTGGLLEVVVAWHGDVEPQRPVAGSPMASMEDESTAQLAERVRGRAEQVVARHAVTMTSTVQHGRPAKVLLERAVEGDLLVLGAPDPTQHRYLGSVAHRCLKDSPVPVVVAR